MMKNAVLILAIALGMTVCSCGKKPSASEILREHGFHPAQSEQYDDNGYGSQNEADQNNSTGGGTYYVPPVNTQNPCGVCSSSGRCYNCGGTGKSPNHAPGIDANCGACGGTGLCATCGGRGFN